MCHLILRLPSVFFLVIPFLRQKQRLISDDFLDSSSCLDPLSSSSSIFIYAVDNILSRGIIRGSDRDVRLERTEEACRAEVSIPQDIS